MTKLQALLTGLFCESWSGILLYPIWPASFCEACTGDVKVDVQDGYLNIRAPRAAATSRHQVLAHAVAEKRSRGVWRRLSGPCNCQNTGHPVDT